MSCLMQHVMIKKYSRTIQNTIFKKKINSSLYYFDCCPKYPKISLILLLYICKHYLKCRILLTLNIEYINNFMINSFWMLGIEFKLFVTIFRLNVLTFDWSRSYDNFHALPFWELRHIIYFFRVRRPILTEVTCLMNARRK